MLDDFTNVSLISNKKIILVSQVSKVGISTSCTGYSFHHYVQIFNNFPTFLHVLVPHARQFSEVDSPVSGGFVSLKGTSVGAVPTSACVAGGQECK